MLKIAVLVSGGGSNLQAIIDAISCGDIDGEIVKVISSKSNAFALERARAAGITTDIVRRKDFSSVEEYDLELLASIVKSGADLIVLAGFLSVLGSEVVNRYRNRIINVHPSLIPSFCGKGYYGLRVHEEVLKSGVKITGATVHFVDEGCDTGPVILQKAVGVNQDDTPLSLQKRVMEEAEWILLPEAIRLIANGCIYVRDGKTFVGEKQL